MLRFKKCIVFILTLTMFLGIFETFALGADNILVLYSIGYQDNEIDISSSIYDPNFRTVGLYVPYSYNHSTVDFTEGIKVGYDKSRYTVVVYFENAGDAIATIGDINTEPTPAKLTVNYSINGQEGTYETFYNIYVTRSKEVTPQFSGEINKTVKSKFANNTEVVRFTEDDFKKLYTKNDGAPLGFISIVGYSNDQFSGSLMFNGQDYVSGQVVSIEDIKAGLLSFKASDSINTSYFVYAFGSSDTLHENPIGQATLNVDIARVSVPTIKSNYARAVGKGTTYYFSLNDFSSLYNLNNGTLENIEITPTNKEYGVWYNGSKSFSSTTKFTTSTISNLKFTANKSGVATFNWVVTNEAGTSTVGTGSLIVSVTSSVSTVTYRSEDKKTIKISSKEINNASKQAGYSALDYIVINNLPPSNYGTLYQGYTTSSNGTYLSTGSKIYFDSKKTPYIDSIAFVPKSGFEGAFSLKYTGVDKDGDTFNSYIKVVIGYEHTVDMITYNVKMNKPTDLDGDDFEDRLSDTNLQTFSYITLKELPPSTYGSFVYNYSAATGKGSKVSTSSKLYYDKNKTPYLDGVTFIPYKDFEGSFTIPYIGYDELGQSFYGNIKFIVGDYEDGVIKYATPKNTTLLFNDQNFEDLCEDYGYKSLNYIRIQSLPSTSYGTLYYNYYTPTNKGTKVATSTKLYYDETTPYISRVAFIPNSYFEGVVEIDFIGYDEYNRTFSGTVKITVGQPDNTDIKYLADKNKNITFKPENFNSICTNAGYETLDYIRFNTLPLSSYGTLYYNYSTSSKKGTKITTSSKLYYSSKESAYLGKVVFVPEEDFEGTFTLEYSGFDTMKNSFTGNVKISVGNASDGTIKYRTTKAMPIAIYKDDFKDICSTVTGEELSYIYFSQPALIYGRLYYKYNAIADYNTEVTSSDKYYADTSPQISDVYFVPNDNYIGDVNINYTGVNRYSESFSGTINITVSDPVSSKHFKDVNAAYDWAVDAIDYLYEKDCVNGTGNSQFSPSKSISRGDFILMLHRAMNYTPNTRSNFSDVPKDSYYYSAIATAKALGIAQGENNKFFPNRSLSRQDAMVLIYRALAKSDINIPDGNSDDLAPFKDANNISSYAKTAVATLVKAGIITGSNGKINPNSSLSRAEMSVILYRVLTYK